MSSGYEQVSEIETWELRKLREKARKWDKHVLEAGQSPVRDGVVTARVEVVEKIKSEIESAFSWPVNPIRDPAGVHRRETNKKRALDAVDRAVAGQPVPVSHEEDPDDFDSDAWWAEKVAVTRSDLHLALRGRGSSPPIDRLRSVLARAASKEGNNNER